MSSSSGGGGVLAGAFSALFGLDRVFFDARKLKTNLKILSGRIKLLSEKRHARIESIERDVEKLLKELFEETTKGLGGGRRGRRKEEDAEKTTMERALMSRVESIENERNFLQILKHVDQFATEILETLCERSIEDVELTSSEAMRTSIASMLHAKSANKGRLTNDLPELKAIANELGKKFGKAFAVSCEREKTSEACGVSKRFIAAIAKCEKKKDERELRAMLERMAGFELPSFAKKTTSSGSSVKTKSKKKKKSALERRSGSSREASASGEEDEENSGSSDDNQNPAATTTIQKKKHSGRRKDKTSSKNQYASAETAAKAARDAANTAREAAEYAEALVATNEVLVAPKKTSPHSDTNDANNNNYDKEEEEEEHIDSVVAAALDEARLEEERTGNASKKSHRAFGGPPPGIASSQKPCSEVDDALATRFETLKTKK